MLEQTKKKEPLSLLSKTCWREWCDCDEAAEEYFLAKDKEDKS